MKNSHIQWTTHTFNPWMGCTKVSEGCTHCYAENATPVRVARAEGRELWGKGAPRQRTKEAWKQVRRWNKEAEGAEHRPRVFCASLADWLDDEVPVEWLADLLTLIKECMHLDFLLLTKRPELWRPRMEAVMLMVIAPGQKGIDQASAAAMAAAWLNGMPRLNVWVGTTVENQRRADWRILHLRKIPAQVRFLSCEPLLGPVDFMKASVRAEADYISQRNMEALDRLCDIRKGIQEATQTEYPDVEALSALADKLIHEYHGINWVICGGESGEKARPFCLEWADDLRRQCERAGVPFFMKQMGEQPYTTNANIYDFEDHVKLVLPVGEDIEGAAGAHIKFRDKKGGDMAEWPEEFQVRQFPDGGEQ